MSRLPLKAQTSLRGAGRGRSSSEEIGKKRVFIVDDHPLMLKGLTQMINDEADLVVAGQAEEPHLALDALSKSQFDIAIIDLSLKDGNGLDLIKMLKSRLPKLPVLVLSAYDEDLYAERAFRVGARGYVMKKEAPEKLLGAVRQIIRGEIAVSEDFKLRMLEKMADGHAESVTSPVAQLGDRELEVFQLIGQGFGTRQIAGKLCVGIKTIDAYRTSIREKLNLENSARLVYCAIQWVEESRKFPT